MKSLDKDKIESIIGKDLTKYTAISDYDGILLEDRCGKLLLVIGGVTNIKTNESRCFGIELLENKNNNCIEQTVEISDKSYYIYRTVLSIAPEYIKHYGYIGKIDKMEFEDIITLVLYNSVVSIYESIEQFTEHLKHGNGIQRIKAHEDIDNLKVIESSRYNAVRVFENSFRFVYMCYKFHSIKENKTMELF